MRISTRNLVAAGTFGPPAAAAGYSAAVLRDGIMATPWRSAAPASSFVFTLAFGVATALDFFAIFDARGIGGTITKVEAFWMAGGIPVSAGELAMNSRGDGSLALLAPVAQTSWRIVVTMSTGSYLQVGEVWMGQRTDVATLAELAPTENHQAVVNGDWGRVDEPMRTTYQLTWPPLATEKSDELLAVIRAAGGGGAPVVIVPDEEEPSRVHLGRFSNSAGFTLRPSRWRMGHSMTFQEGRRPHAA